LLKLKTRKPVIYDVHEDLPKQIFTKSWVPSLLKKPLSFIVDKIEKRLAKFLNYIIAATEHIALNFRFCKKVVVVKNYPLKNPFLKIDEFTDEDILKRSNKIVYVGGVSYLRGFKEMLEIIDVLPSSCKAQLHIIGPLQDVTLNENQIKKLKEKNIFIYGKIPFIQVQKLLLTCKIGLVLLHPTENYKDSLPIKMFEYMAAALPIIASDFPLWRKIICDANCGFVVEPKNIKEICAKIYTLLTDEKLYLAMCKNSLSAFLNKYNWQTQEEELLNLYYNLV